MKKRYYFEILEMLLSVAIIVMAVILFFASGSLSILFPIEFAVGAVLSAVHALEGILFNRNRVVKKTRLIVFGIVSIVLILFSVIAFRTVL